MKVRAFNFISQFLPFEYVEIIKEYIVSKGKSKNQPFKWTGHNKVVPKFVKKYPGVNETVWILIRYEGTFDVLSITEDDYYHDLREEYQRAIAINFTDDTVSWELFKNIKCNSSKMMKTYSKVKEY